MTDFPKVLLEGELYTHMDGRLINARRWARAWKKLADKYRQLWLEEELFEQIGVRDNKILSARIAELEEALRIARPLLQETVDVHSDPESPEYNECDTAVCGWCEEARKVLAAHTKQEG